MILCARIIWKRFSHFLIRRGGLGVGDGNNNSVKHLQLKNEINGILHSNDDDGHRYGSFASLRCYSQRHQTTWLEHRIATVSSMELEIPSISSDDVDTRERALLMAVSGWYSDADAPIWIFISRRKENHSVILFAGFYSAIPTAAIVIFQGNRRKNPFSCGQRLMDGAI